MSDLQKTITAAREALADHWEGATPKLMAEALRDLLAALDAARGEVVAWRYKVSGKWYVSENAPSAIFAWNEVEEHAALYAAPPADEALADTQRAILAAAERRGYERRVKEEAALAVELPAFIRQMADFCWHVATAHKDSNGGASFPAEVIKSAHHLAEQWDEYCEAQQPAAQAVPATDCPHSTRCHCIGVCKYGTAVAGAQPESPWLALAGLVEEVDASFDSAEGLAYIEFYPVKPVDKLIAACREIIKAAASGGVQKVISEMLAIAPTCQNDWDQQLREWAAMLAAAQATKGVE